LAVNDRRTAPGMTADIDANRAIVGTDSALHTTGGIRDHMSRRKNRMSIRITFEN